MRFTCLYRPAAVCRCTVMLALAMSLGFSGQSAAQITPLQFVPFHNFLESTRSAGAADFSAKPGSQVRDSAAFEEMRQHILTMYEGVTITHSFIMDGDHYDCVPIEEQPSVRLLGLKVAAPPPAPVVASVPLNSPGGPIGISSQFTSRPAFDDFGNSLGCEGGTIPMRRVTLEDTTRFETLRNFFEKGPEGAGRAPVPGAAPAPPLLHKYSYTYQYVNNYGQTDTLNLWSPNVNTALGEVFSLAQSWTIGTSPVQQTAEVGWQNYPALYGGQNSRLFIYWTADNYTKTGCYNLTCKGFVQVNNSWAFGAGFTTYSTLGGPQYEFRAEYFFSGGNWWLGLGSSAASTVWVGYYPGSLYGTGPLRTQSNLLEFGSESVGSTVWPAEGSGNWAKNGFGQAAFQRELYYFLTNGTSSAWDSLTPAQPSPNCYSISGPYFGGFSPPTNYWGTYFYFGGPGGSNC